MLTELTTKPAVRFTGKLPPNVLREVADFLTAVAAADKMQDAV
jgi:hypothetical protein